MIKEGSIVKECLGCDKIIIYDLDVGLTIPVCTVYRVPAILWARGGCFYNKLVTFTKTKVRVGQQKQVKIKG